MRIGTILAGVILLMASLFVASRSFTTPTEVNVNKPVVMLKYQQEGEFSYAVSSKPSSFYGDAPASTPESTTSATSSTSGRAKAAATA